MTGIALSLFPCTPPELTLTRCVTCAETAPESKHATIGPAISNPELRMFSLALDCRFPCGVERHPGYHGSLVAWRPSRSNRGYPNGDTTRTRSTHASPLATRVPTRREQCREIDPPRSSPTSHRVPCYRGSEPAVDTDAAGFSVLRRAP